jgi:hypothetical protein
MCFTGLCQGQHSLNLQFQPALANAFDHVVRPRHQLFARAHEILQAAPGKRHRAGHQRTGRNRIGRPAGRAKDHNVPAHGHHLEIALERAPADAVDD